MKSCYRWKGKILNIKESNKVSEVDIMRLISNKYDIVNNQWKWNCTKYKLYQLLDINDLEVLLERGRYLTEIIDKSTSLSYSDFNHLPINGKYILPYGPSSGKTTALRQLFVKSPGDYILYATKLIEDVDKFYYDIVAQYYYLNKKVPSTHIVNKYTSDHPLDIEECRETHILLTTHERLYRDPPTTVYTTNHYFPVENRGLCNSRSAIFIDEYIQMYTNLSVDLARNFGLISNIEFLVDKMTDLKDIESRRRVRSNIINSLIDPFMYHMRSIDNPEINKLFNNTKNLLNLSIKYDPSCRFKFNEHDAKSKLRSEFFLSTICEMYYSKYIDNDPDIVNIDESYLSYKYYLPSFIKSTYILDGTGDILFNSSSRFKVLDVSDQYKRSLKLNHQPRILLDSSFKRLIKTDEDLENTPELIKEKFIKAITKVLVDNPKTKLLVYTWNSLKLNDDLEGHYLVSSDDEDKKSNDITSVMNYKLDSASSLPNYLMSNLPDIFKSRVKFITYQSGKERVTSEFIDCDSILVLGKFRIPQSVINTMNELTQSTMTSNDFTQSLIIQAIYRTSARKGDPIDIYFSDDYSREFINQMMSHFHSVEYIEGIDYKSKIIEEISNLTYNQRNQKYYQYIVDHQSQIIKGLKLLIPASERSDNFKNGMINYINKTNLKVEFTGSQGKLLTFKIYLSNDEDPNNTTE